jgi:TetR/AcrR family transcriptional regulator
MSATSTPPEASTDDRASGRPGAQRRSGGSGGSPPRESTDRKGPRRAPPAGERQRDAERSRATLLAAALDEFAERGFAGARVADIARRAGLNKQLINYYFGSKEGLYLALQQSWLDREESFADPGLPLADLVVRYLEDALQDPRPMRLLLWRGFTDDSAPEGEHDRQPDVDRVRARQQTGEVAADLDPAAVLLAGMGMVAAPLIMPQVARELLGVDPYSPEFGARYAEQLRRIIAHLAETPPAPEDTP